MPSSGSTLLRRILESTSEIKSSGEPWFCLPIISILGEEKVEYKCNQQVIVKTHSAKIDELNVKNDIYGDGVAAYLGKIYNEVLSSSNRLYYLDKTPRYVHIVNEIKNFFPLCKVCCAYPPPPGNN